MVKYPPRSYSRPVGGVTRYTKRTTPARRGQTILPVFVRLWKYCSILFIFTFPRTLSNLVSYQSVICRPVHPSCSWRWSPNWRWSRYFDWYSDHCQNDTIIKTPNCLADFNEIAGFLFPATCHISSFLSGYSDNLSVTTLFFAVLWPCTVCMFGNIVCEVSIFYHRDFRLFSFCLQIMFREMSSGTSFRKWLISRSWHCRTYSRFQTMNMGRVASVSARLTWRLNVNRDACTSGDLYFYRKAFRSRGPADPR